MKKTLPVRATSISLLLAALLSMGCGGEKPESMIASAKEYLAKKDSKAAVIQLKNALQKVPDNAEARFLLGKASLEAGDLTSAEVELGKALELKYPADLVVPPLATALLGRGQAKKVVTDFGKMELGTPVAQADLMATVAAAQIALGDAAGANAALDASLKIKPDFIPALMLQARLKAVKRDLAGALAIVDGILAKDPATVAAWKFKGDLLQMLKGGEEGMPEYRKALELRPDFVSAHAALIQLLMHLKKLDESGKQLEAMQKVAPKSPQTVFLAAQYSFIKKDYKAARDTLQQFHKMVPGTPLSLQLAGAADFAMGSYASAEENLTKALTLQPALTFATRTLISTYLSTGQTAKAVAVLQPMIGKFEDDPGFLALAGEVYSQSGDTKKAEEYYAKSLKLDPNDTVKRTRLAMAHLAKGNANALDELEDIAAADPGTVANLALIHAHIRRNQLDKALQAIDLLLKKTPDDPAVHHLLGQTLIAKKDIPGARKSFEKALSLNAAYFPAANSLASLDLADRKPEDAKRRLEGVLAADSKNLQAMMALAELQVRTKGKFEDVVALLNKAVTANPDNVLPRLALIEGYLQNKDPKKALAVAQEALAALPERPQLVDAVGRAQLAAGDQNQALITFNKLAALQPDSGQPYLRIAEAQVTLKNNDAAIRNLRKGLEVKPDFLDAQQALVLLLVNGDRYDEAVAVARDVQKQRPKEMVGYLLEGDVAMLKKRWPDAVKAYRSGLDKAEVTDLAMKLHTALLANNDKSGADKHADSWRKAHPKDQRFQLFMADTATARQDYAGAMQQYKALLAATPDNPVVLNNLAWAAAQARDPKAQEYAEKANELAPEQPPFMDTLAVILADKGDSAKALEILRKALQIAPQASQIRLSLAKVLVKAGQKADAKKELEELSKLGDAFPAQAEVAKLLKEI